MSHYPDLGLPAEGQWFCILHDATKNPKPLAFLDKQGPLCKPLPAVLANRESRHRGLGSPPESTLTPMGDCASFHAGLSFLRTETTAGPHPGRDYPLPVCGDSWRVFLTMLFWQQDRKKPAHRLYKTPSWRKKIPVLTGRTLRTIITTLPATLRPCDCFHCTPLRCLSLTTGTGARLPYGIEQVFNVVGQPLLQATRR